MDLLVDLGNDFFSYVNGKWVDNFEILVDKFSYGVGMILSDEF